MASLLIEPIQTKSQGGYEVTLTSIDPSDSDCIIGEITSQGAEKQSSQWNRNGTMRDGTVGGNLNMNEDQLLELGNLLDKLGAK